MGAVQMSPYFVPTEQPLSCIAEQPFFCLAER